MPVGFYVCLLNVDSFDSFVFTSETISSRIKVFWPNGNIPSIVFSSIVLLCDESSSIKFLSWTKKHPISLYSVALRFFQVIIYSQAIRASASQRPITQQAREHVIPRNIYLTGRSVLKLLTILLSVSIIISLVVYNSDTILAWRTWFFTGIKNLRLRLG